MAWNNGTPVIPSDVSRSQFPPQEATEEHTISNRDLRQLSFQYMQDGFSIVDLQGVHVDVNPALCRMTGFTAEELIGSSPKHLYWPPREHDRIEAAFARTLRGDLKQIELTFMHKNGTEFPVIVNPFAIREPDNSILYYAATVVDITQQEKIKAELRDSEVRFRALFENAGEAIAIVKDFQIIDCNNQLLELYGFTREEVCSKPLFSFFPPTQPGGKSSREFFQEMVQASRAGTPQTYEWYSEDADGSEVIVEITLNTFTLGNTYFEQAISRNITQRKQMEMALIDLNKTLESRVVQRTEELEKACSELLQRNIQFRALARKLTQAEEEERKRIARVLHDNQQQLLAAAKIKTEMLAEGLHGANTSEVSQQIVEILEQALEGTQSLTMELAPPILYGQGFVTALRWLARWMEDNHHLEVVVSGTLPATPMSGDVSSLLFRAVRELLFNVSRHSGVRKADVSVDLTDQKLTVTVSDNGMGFDIADVLQRQSYGLLSIQEQLIPLNGSLDICSAPGAGTRTTLLIPLSATEGLHPHAPPTTDDTSQSVSIAELSTGGTIRILIADDQAITRDALIQTLQPIEDFHVLDTAVDGLDAVAKAGILRPDVILMDANMPLLDGIEATRRISSQFPGIKIIGHSSHARDDMKPQMAAAGASSYLQKPSTRDELLAAIRGVMKARRAGEV
ncbi:Oxygen sensor histidine kinase NreB [Halioglobus japonicus]|nr:Oxygen sensor histidine kinase NreB [Halioglobus japonicus]